MLHNRYLPDWVHRLANGVTAGFLSLLASLGAVNALGAPLSVLWVALPVVACGMAVDPRRFSLVEGCAGEIGYDELLDDGAGDPDDEAWAEASDAKPRAAAARPAAALCGQSTASLGGPGR